MVSEILLQFDSGKAVDFLDYPIQLVSNLCKYLVQHLSCWENACGRHVVITNEIFGGRSGVEIDRLTSSKCRACGLPQSNSSIVTVHKSRIFLLYTMPERCCAVNCSQQRDKEKGYQLYSFPHDEARRNQWAQALKQITIDPSCQWKAYKEAMATYKTFQALQ